MDLDTLLAPVPGDDSCGEDLAFSADVDAIQEARRADDPSLDQGDWVTDLKTADWAAVSRQGALLLAERSKDLRIAVWWCEARTHIDGFPGLAEGLRLVAGLCARYWDGMHPQDAEDGHEQRVGNLSWLLANLSQWAREVPLVAAAHGRWGVAAFEAARARAVVAERENEAEPDEPPSRPSLASLEKARRETPYAFYLALSRDMPDCVAALAELEREVDRRLGQDGPSFSGARDALDHVQRMVNRFAGEAGVHADDGAPLPAGPDGETAGIEPSPGVGGARAPAAGAIRDRREAIVQLRRVAEFFRRTEPHSPVAYLADKAARWGDMPLHVWLRSVVKDDASLAHLNELLDVATSDEA